MSATTVWYEFEMFKKLHCGVLLAAQSDFNVLETTALYHIMIYLLYRYFGYAIHIVSFILVTQ